MTQRPSPGDRKGIVIHIDHDQFRAPSEEMVGDQLRHLPDPAIPDDRDLWLEVPGGSDELISKELVVELKNGMHFFTAPSTINPG